MSAKSRTVLGDAGNLAETFLMHPDAAHKTIRLRRVWATQDRMLLTGELSEAADSAILELLSLQSELLRHFFQLQAAERHLSARSRRLRPKAGARAIRQVERERQRLGRELHTGVGQLLASIRMQLEVIGPQLPEPPIGVLQALGRISTLAADALEQVRTISKRLHPPEWQRLTLEAALRQLWENSGVVERYHGAMELQPLPREPELEIKVLLYRAAQEALSNLIRHSRATRVTLTLQPRQESVELTISDNGVGFSVNQLFAAPASLTGGIGLRTIRDQAADVGGKSEITSGPNGTTLVISTPYSPIDTKE
ncbi:MAG TPA: sensor histidine kinase [Candidatus Sulfopaludibacter sp.]|jgi:signal transduction histidine kinase|nr:sensor histidine kinase [Candidatus Sulfopaludibacter sp.]